MLAIMYHGKMLFFLIGTNTEILIYQNNENEILVNI